MDGCVVCEWVGMEMKWRCCEGGGGVYMPVFVRDGLSKENSIVSFPLLSFVA